MKKTYVSDAYVIHVRAYRNSSALVDFFTQSDGLIRAVVNGVYGQRKQQLHWKGLLRPLQLLSISWRGEGGLKTLIDLEGQRRALVMPQGQYLYCGFYINELIQRCLSDAEGDETLFQAYQYCAQALLEQHDMQISLRCFEMSLLDALGYGIDFSCDIEGTAVDADKHYRFDVSHGFSVEQQDLKYLIPGRCLQALAARDFATAQVKAVAKYILREALRPHLGVKPIVSRSLFKDL